MRKLILAGLRAHRGRLLLAALATVVGAAFVTSTLALGDTLRAGVEQQIARNSAGIATVVVTDNQLRPLTEDVLTRIRELPGVARADGMISGDVTVLGADGRPLRDAPVGFSTTMRTRLVAGTPPVRDDEVVLAEATARSAGTEVGGTVTVLDPGTGTPRTFHVTGLVDVRGQGLFALRGALGFTPASAAAITGEEGYAEVVVAGGDVTAAVRDVVGDGPYTVSTARAFTENQVAGSGIDPDVLATALVMFAVVALLVAAFVIHNMFAVLVARRTRELALARCLGASRRQVFGCVLAESAVVGTVAALAGATVGLGAAHAAGPIVLDTEAVTVTAATPVLGVLAGLVATVAAALVPARSATATHPMDALRSQREASDGARLGRSRAVAAAVLAAVGAVVTVAGLVVGHDGALAVVGLGGIAVFLATVAAGPALVARLVQGLGRPVARLLGVPGRLAVDNARRTPRRSATTALALVIGVTLTTGVTVITSSLTASVDVGLDQALPADFLIQPPGPGLPRDVAAALRAEDATAVTQIREHPVGMPDGPGMLSTLDGAITPEVIDGALRTGGLALKPDRAAELGVGVGDPVALTVGDRIVTLTVDAVVTGPAVPRALVDPQTIEALVPGRPDALVLVDFPDGTSAETGRAAVERATVGSPTARITSSFDARDRLEQALGQVTAFVAGLLGLAILISLIGIANTTALSVLERTRETAMLRALGLSARRVRVMFTAEALLLGVAGGLVGVVLGIVYGLAAAHVVNERVVLTVPFGTVAALVLGAGAAGVVASLLPARRATGTSVVTALADT